MAVNNDKIFNNNFDTPEFELGSISFELDPSIKDNQNEEERIHFDMIARKIHELKFLMKWMSWESVINLGRMT